MSAIFAKHLRLCYHCRIPAFRCISPSIEPFPSGIATHGRVAFTRASRFYCSSSPDSGDGRRVSARLSQMQQLLQEAEERASYASNEPTPKITLDHVTVSFARSGGPGGQNVNKALMSMYYDQAFNTKVDMRFNVNGAYWLPARVREKIVQMEKNRINKDGDLIISSTKTRTQKGNIEDALGKLQAIIDAASYVPPPPSEEQKKRIEKLAAVEEQRRRQNKKIQSEKKAIRRNKASWD